MKIYALLLLLLLFSVECWAIQVVIDFKQSFKNYSIAAVNTISSIKHILETSEEQSELFVNNIYSNNTVLERVTELSKDECFQKFIKKENLSISFQNQVNQLQIPLQDRLEDIKERLNNIKFLLGLFQGIAERKFQSCKSVNETCIQKTNQWLESTIYNLSCAVPIYPNCSSLSVRKQATCPPKKFKCGTGYCITASFFCDGDCDCADCKDEPPSFAAV
nr:uncharacterized protein LOC106685631 [Halyomorpha halys]